MRMNWSMVIPGKSSAELGEKAMNDLRRCASASSPWNSSSQWLCQMPVLFCHFAVKSLQTSGIGFPKHKP